MDFIERFFGISPDGGNGAFEILWLALPISAAALAWIAMRRRAKRAG